MSGLPAGYKVDSLPPGYKVDSVPSAPSFLDTLKHGAQAAGSAIDTGYRNLGAARTAAARDPVHALSSVLGAQASAIAPAVKPVREWLNAHNVDPTTGKVVPLSPVGKFLEDTAFDPLTYEGGLIGRGVGAVAKPAVGAIARAVKPVGDYARDVGALLKDPALAPAVSKVGHAAATITRPLRFGVNTGKELLFINPLPHGVGNMATLSALRSGAPTALKGLWYGARGAPQASSDALQRIGAGAWTPEMMKGDQSEGLISKLGRLPVPAVARAGAGAAAGGGIAGGTSPSTDTPQQRAARIAEGTILGAITGAAPEALEGSNKLMTRLETGQRAAMLEKIAPELTKPATRTAPVAAKAATKLRLKPSDFDVSPTGAITLKPRVNPDTLRGRGMNTPLQRQPAPRIRPSQPLIREPSAAESAAAGHINATFGGGAKGPVAKLASALGGPFAQWQAEVVPRNVGRALSRTPAGVEAFARGQDEANQGPLRDQPYKLQVGGPVGAFAELLFNTPKYASRLGGPLTSGDPNAVTNPSSLSLGDHLRGTAYDATPGREVVGPFFGDTMFPEKAPAGPSAALQATLGWHFANKTPKADAVLDLMKTTGLDAYQAGKLYDRYRPK